MKDDQRQPSVSNLEPSNGAPQQPPAMNTDTTSHVPSEIPAGGASKEIVECNDLATVGDQRQHDPVVVATLILSVITVALLVLLAGAYVIQQRRFSRSRSVSIELQPTASDTGISLPPLKTTSTGAVGGGSSTSAHMKA